MNENTFYPEIGCYGLAGHTASPRDLLDEVRLAERLGIGSVFLSERFNVKDAAVLAGAAAAATETIGIATAATNHNTRHPLVTATFATFATTMHRLSGGRYAFGLGRGFDVLFDLMGVPRVTGAQLETRSASTARSGTARPSSATTVRPAAIRTSPRTARSTRTSRC